MSNTCPIMSKINYVTSFFNKGIIYPKKDIFIYEYMYKVDILIFKSIKKVVAIKILKGKWLQLMTLVNFNSDSWSNSHLGMGITNSFSFVSCLDCFSFHLFCQFYLSYDFISFWQAWVIFEKVSLSPSKQLPSFLTVDPISLKNNNNNKAFNKAASYLMAR